ncbi:MAG: hypothetical protein IPJ65_06135 [Archangiaceae bacterium]|nr:hypothetical protein [Archangiaceae bacterium]
MKVLALVLLAALAAGKKKAPPAPKPPPPLLTEPTAKMVDALGEKTAGMLSASTRVTLYRVSAQAGVRPNPALAVGGEYERQGAGRELTDGELKRFKALVYDDKSFKLGAPPPCSDFKPELALLGTSSADTGQLELLVSFKCGGVMFFTAKTAGRSLPGAQLDLKPSRKVWLTMVKELLPQDAAVQALK